jgi:predicted metal-dependent enzyme (double-stranded beta helix superfamily)
MVASDRFEAWVIAWPPGGSIELHDHGGSAGAVVVASGQLTETTLFELKDQEVEIETTTLTAGESMTVAPNDIHDVANLAAVPAISVHVYSPRLTAMTFYQITHRRLQVNRTVSYRLGEANP